jgi:hypothetical protein
VLHATPVCAEVELGDGQVAIAWQRGRHTVAIEAATKAIEASRAPGCAKVIVESVRFVDKCRDDIGDNAGGS